MSTRTKRTWIHKEHVLALPRHLAEWDVWEYWEKPRLDSIRSAIAPGELLIDVGAEQGWMAALYAQWGIKVALVEPEPHAWNCIREIFEANDLEDPVATYPGLFGRDVPDHHVMPDFDASKRGAWPECAYTGECGPRAYRYLHEPGHLETTPRTTLTDWCRTHELEPAGITIDVEGAEVEVLFGAQALLADLHPIVWCSIHPDLMARDYQAEPRDVLKIMGGLGYDAVCLAIDHEEHWEFRPR